MLALKNIMNRTYLQKEFDAGLTWGQYLATDTVRAPNWTRIYEQVHLTPDQRTLIGGFVREVRMLCLSGIWCGDCVQQGPLIQRIAEANPCLDLRWLDRDEHLDLAEQIRINAGLRVPVVIFMAEDCEPVSIFGDRTLTRYRALAARQLGATCPMPGAPVPDDELRGTLQDWLDEVERVHLLLRTSARLRQLHRD